MKKETFKVSFEPHLIDLINTYFPEEYAKKYSNVQILFKTASALLLPKMKGSHDYPTMCMVQSATQRLWEKNHDITPTQVLDDPSIRKIVRKYYSDKTVRKWIRPVLALKPGRPKKTHQQ